MTRLALITMMGCQASLNSGLASDDDIENILAQFDQPFRKWRWLRISDQPPGAPSEQPSLDIPNLDLWWQLERGRRWFKSNSTDLLDEMLDSESDELKMSRLVSMLYLS